MQLCFDATRFGSGLQEAVEFAAAKNIGCLEYAFEKFEVSQKSARSLSKDEKNYLLQVHELAQSKDVKINSLRLKYLLKPGDKNAQKEFKIMLNKLALVAKVLQCKRLLFQLEARAESNWLAETELVLSPLLESMAELGISLLLSLSTAETFQGKSLRTWRPLEPQEWRELLAGLPGLALSFSVADCAWQGIDYLRLLSVLVHAIEHVEAQDVQVNRQMIAENGLFGPLWWRYMSVGKGQVDWGQFVEALKLYDYKGSISIQFNDEYSSLNEEGLWEALDAGIKVLAPLVKY